MDYRAEFARLAASLGEVVADARPCPTCEGDGLVHGDRWCADCHGASIVLPDAVGAR